MDYVRFHGDWIQSCLIRQWVGWKWSCDPTFRRLLSSTLMIIAETVSGTLFSHAWSTDKTSLAKDCMRNLQTYWTVGLCINATKLSSHIPCRQTEGTCTPPSLSVCLFVSSCERKYYIFFGNYPIFMFPQTLWLGLTDLFQTLIHSSDLSYV